MSVQPEVGKKYFVCLPGAEACSERAVVEMTEHTVLLGRPYHFEDWYKPHPQDVTRYPRASVRFVEEMP